MPAIGDCAELRSGDADTGGADSERDGSDERRQVRFAGAVELRSSADGNSWNFELFDRKSKTVLWHEEVPVVMNGQDR